MTNRQADRHNNWPDFRQFQSDISVLKIFLAT